MESHLLELEEKDEQLELAPPEKEELQSLRSEYFDWMLYEAQLRQGEAHGSR